MIPIRVPAEARPVLASDRRFTVRPDHPLYLDKCPVCEHGLGQGFVVLILAGINPDDRKDSGFTTGAAVAVHERCAR